ncbi:MAG: OB-fold nucleic acid binding domain-containing protein [Candidatus Bathyarchaeia archaeon]
MSIVQTIVEDILSKRRELSQEQILALIEEKKREGRGLLSDEGAARLVAEELLIQTRGTDLGRMQVKDLVSGLNDVTISGRILMTWPPQQFQRRDGTPGRVMRIVLADKSDRVRCAIWDRHVDVLSRTDNLQGRVMRIGHAYTRQGLSGDTEVHAGDRSSIQIDPEDMPKSDLPEFGDLFTPLGKLEAGASQVNAVAIVQSEPRYYSFAKEERTGSVLRAIVADESGSIPLVAWNERAEELRELKNGDIIQMMNGRVRLDKNARLELHVESRSQIQLLKSAPDYLKIPSAKPKSYKIADLNDQTGSADIRVSVLAKGLPQEIKRPTGESVKVARLIVADESGIVSLSLWDDKAQLVNDFEEGDILDLKGVSIRERMGEVMLSLGRSGGLQKSSEKAVGVRPATTINALQQSKGLVIVEGSVSDQPLARQVVTEKGETISLSSFTLRDSTSSAKVTFWRDQAADALKLRPGVRVRIQGLRVRTGLTGEFELSSIPLSRIEVLDEVVRERPAWEDIRHVIALEPGLSTWIKGVVLEVPEDSKLIAVCETCGSTLRASENEYTCETCKHPRPGRFVFTGRVRVDDGTGLVDVVFSDIDEQALPMLNLAEAKHKMVSDHESQVVLSKGELLDVVGKEIEVYGVAKQLAGNGKFELIAKKALLASTP